jgi:glycosyltransferase involved in cell wall biosynthesis
LSSALKCKGHDVAVCGLPGSPPVLKARDAGLDTFEVGVNSSNPLKILAAMGAMDRIMMSYQPDIVIANRGEFYGYFAWRRMTKQNFRLVRVRGDIRPPKNGLLNRTFHNRCTDAIICSGNFIADHYRTILKTPESALNVVYGGVDTNKFKKSEFARIKIRDEFGFSEEDHVVGIVGRFDPIKGHENLIKAVSKVYREGRKNIRLVIAGFDAVSATDSIMKMISDNGIEDITVITGFREDIADIYNSFDVCVVSSLGSEAICRVGMEAMACGVPLITSDTGVLPEISKNVYPKNDWERLSELLTDYEPSTTTYSLEGFSSAFQKIMRM